MTKHAEPVTVVCGSCGARYTVQVSWFDSAIEFRCSCDAHLRVDPDDLSQVRHDMLKDPEVALRPLR
jgi:hypothetical protein